MSTIVRMPKMLLKFGGNSNSSIIGATTFSTMTLRITVYKM